MSIDWSHAGSVTILACRGATGREVLAELPESTNQALETGCRRLVLNLRELQFADSATIAFVITVARRVSEAEGELVVSEPSSFLLKTLKTLGLDAAVRAFPDDRAALAYFGEKGGDLGVGARLKPPRPSGEEGAWPEDHPRP